MRQQTVLRFCISLKETFSSAITFPVIKKYPKRTVLQIARKNVSFSDIQNRKTVC